MELPGVSQGPLSPRLLVSENYKLSWCCPVSRIKKRCSGFTCLSSGRVVTALKYRKSLLQTEINRKIKVECE